MQKSMHSELNWEVSLIFNSLFSAFINILYESEYQPKILTDPFLHEIAGTTWYLCWSEMGCQPKILTDPKENE